MRTLDFQITLLLHRQHKTFKVIKFMSRSNSMSLKTDTYVYINLSLTCNTNFISKFALFLLQICLAKKHIVKNVEIFRGQYALHLYSEYFYLIIIVIIDADLAYKTRVRFIYIHKNIPPTIL